MFMVFICPKFIPTTSKKIMKLFIGRHMETVANEKKIILGRRDSPPTETGMDSCRKLAALAPLTGTGIVLSSPLGRAVATAVIFAAATGWTTVRMDGLTELSCGEWEGRTRLSVLPPGRPLRSTWTDSPGGGESCAVAATRVAEVIHHLRRSTHENILIIGHAAVNQVFLKIWLSLEPHEALAVQHPHNLLYEIENQRVVWLDSAGAAGEGLVIKK